MKTVFAKTPVGFVEGELDGDKLSRLQLTNRSGPISPKLQKSVDAFFKNKSLGVTLSPQGTAFQQKVWGILSKVKHGKTMTYSDVAKAVGKPKAFRAVANACGKNPIVLFIPCHRIVGKNGHLGGYSGMGGIKSKQKLLDLESSID